MSKLIVITLPEANDFEAKVINDLFAAGLQRLHIRKPRGEVGEIRKLLDAITPEYHDKIVVGCCYEVAKEYNLLGVHYPERIWRNTEESINDSLFGKGNYKHISISAHSVLDLIDFSDNTDLHVDYVLYGPVFPSLSKPGYGAEFAESGNRMLAKCELRFPVIGLGGIKADNIRKVSDLGYQGSAVIGGVWFAEDPVKAFLELQAVYE